MFLIVPIEIGSLFGLTRHRARPMATFYRPWRDGHSWVLHPTLKCGATLISSLAGRGGSSRHSPHNEVWGLLSLYPYGIIQSLPESATTEL
jgi:hypothetical protein